MNLSLNLIENSNDETNFPHKLLITDTQVWKICNVFANGSSANLKFSKSQIYLLEIRTEITGIDNFINFPLKMPSSYLKELSNMGSKRI